MNRTLVTSAAAIALCALATTGFRHRAAEISEPAAAPQLTEATFVPTHANYDDEAPQAPSSEEAPRIRRAIRESVAEQFPGSEVEGIWVLQARGNYCFAGADTVLKGRHRNIDVLVRQYTREDGTLYWRGESFGPGGAAQMKSALRALSQQPSHDDDTEDSDS